MEPQLSEPYLVPAISLGAWIIEIDWIIQDVKTISTVNWGYSAQYKETQQKLLAWNRIAPKGSYFSTGSPL